MISLLQLGPIIFDLTMLISFIIGISFGFILFLLIYLYAVIKSLNKGSRLRKVDEEDIDEEEVKWLIKDAVTQFQDKKLRDETGFSKLLTQLSKQLSMDIAAKFYPQSKYPLLELTIDEIIILMRYVSDRFDKLLDHKLLKLFRGMTITRLMSLYNTKELVENNLIVKTGLKTSKIFKKVISVLNIINPVYWIRKAVVDNMTKVIMVKLGVAVISITGEETYKIYSKKVFNEIKEIDTGIDSIYDDLKKVMIEEQFDEEEN